MRKNILLEEESNRSKEKWIRNIDRKKVLKEVKIKETIGKNIKKRSYKI